MHEKFLTLTPQVYEYLVAHSAPPDDVLRELAAETAALGPVSIMQIAVEQGAFLTLLARLMGARRAVEVGTFTGYSAICIARGLADGGRLLCCDVNPEWTAIARRYWTRPGLDTLRALPPSAEIDLAFVDADKSGYRAYYEELLPRLRANGLIVFDNVLWSGSVAEPAIQDDDTRALRALADHVCSDARVEPVMLAVADGLLLARKR